jgi:hypothetical protein
MFPNPFAPPPPPPPGSRLPSGITPQEKGKMILLGVALLLVLGVMGGMFAFYGAGDEPPPSAGDPMDIPASKGGAEGPLVEFKPAPLFPEEEGAEVERILREDLAEWKDVVDGVAAVDPRPHDYILDQVSRNARIMNLAEASFDGEMEPSSLLDGPAAHRGKLVLVSGTLLSLEREPYEIETGLVKEVRRGLLRDGPGRLWTFTWPVGNPLEPDPVQPGEGWVRVQGVFYKVWPAADPESGEEVPTPHLVLQRRPKRDYPRIQVRDLDTAWFDLVHDETPADMSVRDEDPLFYLLNLSSNIGANGWEGWAKAKQARDPGLRIWPPEDLTGRYTELLDRPEVYRFRPIRYVGYIARPSVIREIRPNPGNVEQAWISFLVDQDGAPALWVYSPRSIVDLGFKDGDRVSVEGFFMKRVAYEPVREGPMKRAAVLVATRILPAPMPENSVARTILLIVGGFMLLMAGLLGWTIVQGRREAETAEKRRAEMQERRRRAHPDRPPLAPPSPAAPAPPEPTDPPSPDGGP